MFDRDIDSDEGFRFHTDWDSHADAAAFFTEARHACEACGQPADEVRRASWDSDLLVGPCCYQNESIPDVPVCPALHEVIKRCPLTSSVIAAMEAHKECCDTCRVVERKGVGSQTRVDNAGECAA